MGRKVAKRYGLIGRRLKQKPPIDGRHPPPYLRGSQRPHPLYLHSGQKAVGIPPPPKPFAVSSQRVIPFRTNFSPY